MNRLNFYLFYAPTMFLNPIKKLNSKKVKIKEVNPKIIFFDSIVLEKIVDKIAKLTKKIQRIKPKILKKVKR